MNTSLSLELVVGPGCEGVGPVLARGLEKCRYELVVRADSDDVSLAERCAVQVAWMNQHPRVKASSALINEFDQRWDQPVAQRAVPIGSKRIYFESRFRNPLNHPAVVIRRSAVIEVGNYRDRQGFEDYDLWLRLQIAYGMGALANLPQVLVLARVGRAHLARRHGFGYLVKELSFFYYCGRDRLLPWASFVVALISRLPLRLLPSIVLGKVMMRVVRRKPG
jgi:hypothetical protein